MHQKPLGGRAPPGPAGGAHSAPPDALAGLQGWAPRGEGAPGRGGKEGREREGEGGEGRKKGGDGKGFISVEINSWIRP